MSTDRESKTNAVDKSAAALLATLPPGCEWMAERILKIASQHIAIEDMSVGDVGYTSMAREPEHLVEVVALRHPTDEERRAWDGLKGTDIVADVRDHRGAVSMIGGTLVRANG